ncbi:MAG: LuxR C-terminal-related transcriptional regulator [Ignavibacteriota bacterium]
MNKADTLLKDLEQITAEYRRSGSLGDAEPEIVRILAESRKLKWAEGIARSLYLQSRLAESQRDMKTAEMLNQQAKELAEATGLDSLLIDCLASQADIFFWNNQLKDAYRVTVSTLAKAETQGNAFAEATCNSLIGKISKRYASDEQALRYFQTARDAARRSGFLSLEGSILHSLTELFLFRLRFAQAEQYAMQCVNVQEKLGSPEKILRAKIRLATTFIEGNKLPQAEELLDEIEVSKEYLQAAEKGTLALCRGKIAQKKKRYAEAQKNFDKAIAIFRKTGRDVVIANAYGIVCENHLERKNAAEALSYAKRTLRQIGVGKDEYMQSQAFRLMYEASKLSKDAVNALKYLELHNERFTKQEEQLLETRIQFIELRAEYQMRQSEITHERRRAKELRVELQFKEQELTEKTRHLIRQTDVIAQFRDDLRAIIHRSSADDPLVREIKDRLKQVSESTETWEEFNREFEAAHPAFLTNLAKKHPLLSIMEKKICSLLRVGLTSTDIAKLLHLSDRNIENHRYRIRKKVELNTEKSLHEYLVGI